MVKFAGPFVRLPVGKLGCRRNRPSRHAEQCFRPLCRLHAGPDLPVPRLATPSIRSSSGPAKWIISAMERNDGDDVVPLTHEQLATPAWGRPLLYQPGDPDLQGGGAFGRPAAARSLVRNPDSLRVRSCPLQRGREEPFRGGFAGGLSRPRKGQLGRCQALKLPCRNRLTNRPNKPLFFDVF